MLAYILYGLFILACAVLIIVILLQPGKADAGALFTSSVSSTAFGPRGTQTILARITIGAAVAFMLLALMLALPAVNGSHSVLQSDSAPVSSPSPSPSASTAPASVPVTTSSPASTAPPAQTSASPATPEAKQSPEQKSK